MIFDKDNWQEIFATIKKNRLRTFLTAFGVFWGIFMLVIMLGSGNGLKKGVLQDFKGTATNSFYMWAQKTSKPYKGMRPGRRYNFNNDDAIALREQLPELADIAPMNQLGGHQGSSNVVRGLKSAGFGVYGVYPVIGKIRSIKMERGRFLNDNDIKEKRKVIVIGRRVREILFKKEEDPIGEYLRVNGVYFKVIGVTLQTRSGGDGQEQAQSVHMPFTTFQQAFNYGNIVGWFCITSRDEVPAEVAETKAMMLLKERHKIDPADMLAIGHWNMGTEFNKLNGLFVGIEFLIWFVGIGTLFAGVIGVSNIMLIIVKERTKEIGVKRALGATPGSVIGQLILESIFLTSLAGYFGLLAGIWLLETVSGLIPKDETSMFQNPEINFRVAITALVVLIISGALAGLIPAKRAVSISPVDALRSE